MVHSECEITQLCLTPQSQWMSLQRQKLPPAELVRKMYNKTACMKLFLG